MSSQALDVTRIEPPVVEAAGRKDMGEEARILAQALRSVREAVNITDMQDNILFVNDSFRKMYGYREEELIGKPIGVVWSAKNPPDVVRQIPLATARGGWGGAHGVRYDGARTCCALIMQAL